MRAGSTVWCSVLRAPREYTGEEDSERSGIHSGVRVLPASTLPDPGPAEDAALRKLKPKPRRCARRESAAYASQTARRSESTDARVTSSASAGRPGAYSRELSCHLGQSREMRRLARVRWQRRCRRKRRRPLLEPGVEQPDQLGDGVGLDGGGLNKGGNSGGGGGGSCGGGGGRRPREAASNLIGGGDAMAVAAAKAAAVAAVEVEVSVAVAAAKVRRRAAMAVRCGGV